VPILLALIFVILTVDPDAELDIILRIRAVHLLDEATSESGAP
jgi:hypothetical protein